MKNNKKACNFLIHLCYYCRQSFPLRCGNKTNATTIAGGACKKCTGSMEHKTSKCGNIKTSFDVCLTCLLSRRIVSPLFVCAFFNALSQSPYVKYYKAGISLAMMLFLCYFIVEICLSRRHALQTFGILERQEEKRYM